MLVAIFAGSLLLGSDLASAQNEQDFLVRNADGRLRGYPETDVILESGDSPVYAYFAFAGLALVSMIVLFKDARRTHLD
jgi:hypothetical protein